jgi:DNA-binding response OmpR family regulator
MQENADKKKLKILLLEDYPEMISFYTGKLKEAGFDVIAESDEDHGLTLVQEEKPDLVILDISLPKSDDFAFIKELKKNSKIAAIPVVVLTDLSAQENIDEGINAGAADYLVRDYFTFAEVIDKIKQVIDKQLKDKK